MLVRHTASGGLQSKKHGCLATINYRSSRELTVILTKCVCVCVFQPGCVNTTEVDIKKSSRMKNPHKTRKVMQNPQASRI